MKFAQFLLSSAALLSLAHAWNEDPRCPGYGKWRKLEPDMSLVEDGLTTKDIQAQAKVSPKGNGLRGTSDGLDEAERNRILQSYQTVTYFQMKMYWQEGYCWQEEWEEREWCMECQGGSCNTDDYVWTEKCDSREDAQLFFSEKVYDPNNSTVLLGHRLRSWSRPDLCYDRTRVNAYQFRTCSSSDTQILVNFALNGRFELRPYNYPDKCLNQHHHPKPEEIVRAEFCTIARKHKTSRWIVHNPVTVAFSESQPDIQDEGGSYCNNRLCGLCEGDCDNDNQCAGDLVCFKRDAYESVPGCNGGDDSSSRTDFCVHPLAAGKPASGGPAPTNGPAPTGPAPTKPSGGSPPSPTPPLAGGYTGEMLEIDDKGSEYCDSNTCGLCEGDCDDDSQCEGDLLCYERDEYEAVPGCKGGEDASSKSDFCYDPNWNNNIGSAVSSPPPPAPTNSNPSPTNRPPTNPPPTHSIGGTATLEIDDKGSEYCDDHLCGLCEGDCDDDSQCAGDLICYERDEYEAVPGCSGGEDASSRSDFCVEP